jgi:hypothetical protein
MFLSDFANGRSQSDRVKRGNWIQSMPGKGWFYNPSSLQSARTVLQKKWRPGEIELVK